MTFYGADLARIHDEGFGDHARAAAAELLARLERPGTIVELGCGSGISCRLLADAGHQVVGIDLSEEMLAVARGRVPEGEFRQASIWDTPLPRCSAVTAIGEIVNYAADERAGSERLPELFARIYAALEPGGVFLLDFATHGRGTLGAEGGRREGAGWRMDYAASEDPDDALLERTMTWVLDGQEGGETHLLRLYDRETVRARLVAAGFEPEALETYGDQPFWPGYAAFMALKPG